MTDIEKKKGEKHKEESETLRETLLYCSAHSIGSYVIQILLQNAISTMNLTYIYFIHMISIVYTILAFII
jgi:hypothetical protein